MTERQIVHFIHNLILETSTFNSNTKFKYEHTLRKYSFEEDQGHIIVTEKFTPRKSFMFNNNVLANSANFLYLFDDPLKTEWFEEFKLVVKHDIKTEIHNLLFDKLT